MSDSKEKDKWETSEQALQLGKKENPFIENTKRLKKNKLAFFGVCFLAILIIIALLAPVITPYDPFSTITDESGETKVLASPSSEHLLGTDRLGRDVLSRVIYGGRVSLSVAMVAVGISTTIGIVLGMLAGYYGGLIDSIIMRITDVVICFPVLFLVISVATLLKPNMYNVMIVIGLVGWTTMTRLVRGEVLRIKEMEFVEAARA